MSKIALAALSVLFLSTAGMAAAATMDCCKDCKCCEEMKGDAKAPDAKGGHAEHKHHAPAEAPKPAQ